MKVFIIMLTMGLGIAPHFAYSSEAGGIMDVCKEECPKAKTDEETHKCVEKKGRLNKEFRKSKCWEVNEEYEKRAASKPEHK